MVIHLKQNGPIVIQDDKDCVVTYKKNRVSVGKRGETVLLPLYTFLLAELIYIDFQNI